MRCPMWTCFVIWDRYAGGWHRFPTLKDESTLCGYSTYYKKQRFCFCSLRKDKNYDEGEETTAPKFNDLQGSIYGNKRRKTPLYERTSPQTGCENLTLNLPAFQKTEGITLALPEEEHFDANSTNWKTTDVKAKLKNNK